jgi:hypothetical protein
MRALAMGAFGRRSRRLQSQRSLSGGALTTRESQPPSWRAHFCCCTLHLVHPLVHSGDRAVTMSRTSRGCSGEGRAYERAPQRRPRAGGWLRPRGIAVVAATRSADLGYPALSVKVGAGDARGAARPALLPASFARCSRRLRAERVECARLKMSRAAFRINRCGDAQAQRAAPRGSASLKASRRRRAGG